MSAKEHEEYLQIMRTVSTWSLHRTLGRYVAPDSAVFGGPFMPGSHEPQGIPLLDLPQALKEHGYNALQIVHFHLPSTSPEYLADLREALQAAGITLETLLIDDGDLTHPERADEVEAWVSGWLGVAEALGATRARVIAGHAEPTPERIGESAARLRRLAERHPNVRLVIENWSRITRDAQSVRSLLEATDGQVGLLIDLGNWKGPDKYDELARIAPFAETCHAKCHFSAEGPDSEDYRRTLLILKDANYAGPLALIYDGPDEDEWGNLELEDAIVREVFG